MSGVDNTLDTLMYLVDRASDSAWDTDLPRLESAVTDFEMRVQANQESIRDALGAIVLLLLRRDEEMWEAWLKY